MRVCLIIPPCGFLLDERVFPSLGVLKVAAVLERTPIDVKVWDFSGYSEREMAACIQRSDPADMFGITATMPQMPAAAQIARHLKNRYPTTRLILGGPHVTLLHASAKQERARGMDSRACAAMRELHALFDVLVCGDGEHAIGIAVSAHPPTLIDADDPQTTLFLTKADLNAAPLAARHLIDLDSYHYAIDGHKTHSLIGQLGCPMGCAFCGGRRSPFLRRVRTRTTANVVAEVRHLHEAYGATGFMFLDDELNVNRQFMDLLGQLSDLQSDLGVAFVFRGLLKSELLTDPMAAAMARTGFRQILVGFESGSERMLLNMRKNATRDDNTRCVETLRRHGIAVKALMSFGHAGESRHTIAETRAWLLEVQPDDFDVTIITVYPGTPYYDDAVESSPGVWTYTDPKNGDRLHALPVDHLRDVNFYKGIPGEYQSFVYTDTLTREDLVHWRDVVESDVRHRLHIPFPTSHVEHRYEHSMGMR